MPGIAIALKLMTPGERRRVWIPAGLSYKPEEAPQGPALTVEVELVSITKAPRRPQNLTTPPESAQKLLSGVTIDWLKSSKGKVHPAMDSKVTVHFSGWTASGKLFQTTVMDGQPATMPLGTALPGWREALPLMTPGDKARVWIPAALAYGTKPPSKRIPAGNLVYEIELLKVD
jgi:FKBP-type peptidyl-prolyl cis-trans isomerase